MILIYKNVNDLYVTIIKVSRVLRSDRLAERIGTKDFGKPMQLLKGQRKDAVLKKMSRSCKQSYCQCTAPLTSSKYKSERKQDL